MLLLYGCGVEKILYELTVIFCSSNKFLLSDKFYQQSQIWCEEGLPFAPSFK